MNNKVFLVTGAQGHLGNTIVKELVAKNEKVRGLVLQNDNLTSLDNVNCEIFRGDVCNIDSLKDFFSVQKDTDLYVIHTAGIVSIASKFQQKVYDVNVMGTKNIIKMCKSANVKRLVHVSSVHAIPELVTGQQICEVNHFTKNDVNGLYAQTKAEASQLVLASGLDAVIVHPSGIIGPNDYGNGHLTQLIMDFLDGRLTACVKGGYDFVDVRDVAQGVLSAMEKGRRHECYILSNEFVAIKDLLQMVSKISGKREIKTVLPLWLAQATAPLAESYYKLLKQPPLYTKYSLSTLKSNGNFSHKKATEELSYYPRKIEQTLSDTVSWLRENNRVKK